MLSVILESLRLLVGDRGKREATMRAGTVYRVDYGRKTKDSNGALLEMQTTERGHNYDDLLRLARRLFALGASEVNYRNASIFFRTRWKEGEDE